MDKAIFFAAFVFFTEFLQKLVEIYESNNFHGFFIGKFFSQTNYSSPKIMCEIN